jgi:DNA-binding CsgD family transcriptional regulator
VADFGRGEVLPSAMTVGRHPRTRSLPGQVSVLLCRSEREAASGLSLANGREDQPPWIRRNASAMTAGSRRLDRTTLLRGRSRELSVLGTLVDNIRAGQSKVLVVRGDLGIGKTALLDWLAGRAPGCRVVRAAGVQAEMELSFATLQQVCAQMMDHAEQLSAPQRGALRTAFGISAGPTPDRFLVGLAALALLSEEAGKRPLLCIVDDAQWLDRASAQALGFVARRLAAKPVALVFAARVPVEELAGLPDLTVEGLRPDDARTLLDSVLAGPLDLRVRDRIIAEARGNPLALLELPRGLPPAELAGGFGLPGALPLEGRTEQSFRQQFEALPTQTRRLLLLAAADPSGDRSLVWRAARRLGIPEAAAIPAVEAGLVEFGAWVRFRHPLARPAAYRSAPLAGRRQAHAALAEATDPQIDPDRCAWHRAQAATGPDEKIAGELERTAGRALACGGLAAAAAFLARAAMLTPGPVRRAQRLLAAARAKRDGGALDEALELLAAAGTGPLDQLQAAEVERLRGQIAFDRCAGTDAPRLLLRAARRLEPLSAALARETHLEALLAAIWSGDPHVPVGVREAAEAARSAPPASDPPRAIDVLLDAAALRFTAGYATAAPAVARALGLLLGLKVGAAEADCQAWLTSARVGTTMAIELWDFESWQVMAARQVQLARDAGALVHLQFALPVLVTADIIGGELATAAQLADENRLIGEAAGTRPTGYPAMMLAAWRGQEATAVELIETVTQEAAACSLARLVNAADYARSALYNGLGHHDAARDAARRAFERDVAGFGPLVVPELAEAAARTGDTGLVRAALEWLTERTRVTPSHWAVGIEAQVRALLSEGEEAESHYRESIERLSRTGVRVQLARAHLLYGEWLRRERRRGEAREQLRTAYEMLDTMGVGAFAERARRELQATGADARKRAVDPAIHLTAQEAQVARLARDGLSNPDIGARLFISTRTVQYHLGKVFTKVGISSRSQLHRVLPGDANTIPLR